MKPKCKFCSDRVECAALKKPEKQEPKLTAKKETTLVSRNRKRPSKEKLVWGGGCLRLRVKQRLKKMPSAFLPPPFFFVIFLPFFND